MKKRWIILLGILVSLTACTKPVITEVPENQDKDEEQVIVDGSNEEENENPIEEETDMSNSVCKNSINLVLNNTHTLNHDVLWNNSVVCENLKYTEDGIVLDNPTVKGTLETGGFPVSSFNEIVPTWNVVIDSESEVTILMAIGNENGYSNFYIMGYWKESYKASFSNQEDDYGKVYIDTIVPKEDDIDRVKFKVIFKKGNESYPQLQNLSITTKTRNEQGDRDYSSLENYQIDVSPRQQLSIPEIGNSICSPTSTSMVLDYYSHSDSQQEVASYIYDAGAGIYGNWSFNASYAGGFIDTFSRVEYTDDIDVLFNYIKSDIPLVLSIKTTNKSDLQGSIMAYPSGHLIVLMGFKNIDGVWYGVVNDPAEYHDDSVQREYLLDELLDAWRGYMYVIQISPFND